MQHSPVSTAELDRALSLIRSVPDYPEPGVTFRDITPLLADRRAFTSCMAALIEPYAGEFDVVAGIEARGFILAGALAVEANRGFIPLRKKGKLPQPVASVNYNLEYGTETMEVSADLAPGMKVLLVDDILATGGSLRAGMDLIQARGAELVGIAVLLELAGLGGREIIPDAKALFRL
ncbi:adenine phosphoribosyltransferase [Auritidibacter ignavus]|uniref:adenine phosphoribosyltransferase n=1 Tax=Auritidibacter ignavus TaxID=678932 RepID=UPI00109D7859|nr:adenine phosphoribosyltransferase [Auritidibacter ignavus]